MAAESSDTLQARPGQAPAISDVDLAELSKLDTEEKFCAYMTRHLQAFCSDGYVVINSERLAWTTGWKPDFFIAHKKCYDARKPPKGAKLDMKHSDLAELWQYLNSKAGAPFTPETYLKASYVVRSTDCDMYNVLFQGRVPSMMESCYPQRDARAFYVNIRMSVHPGDELAVHVFVEKAKALFVCLRGKEPVLTALGHYEASAICQEEIKCASLRLPIILKFCSEGTKPAPCAANGGGRRFVVSRVYVGGVKTTTSQTSEIVTGPVELLRAGCLSTTAFQAMLLSALDASADGTRASSGTLTMSGWVGPAVTQSGLRAAFRAVLRQSPVLRSRFARVSGRYVQVVLRSSWCVAEFRESHAPDSQTGRNGALRLAAAAATLPPLQCKGQAEISHNALCDGWSMNALLQVMMHTLMLENSSRLCWQRRFRQGICNFRSELARRRWLPEGGRFRLESARDEGISQEEIHLWPYCQWCHATSGVELCADCSVAAYCSQTCQEMDAPRHNLWCYPLLLSRLLWCALPHEALVFQELARRSPLTPYTAPSATEAHGLPRCWPDFFQARFPSASALERLLLTESLRKGSGAAFARGAVVQRRVRILLVGADNEADAPWEELLPHLSGTLELVLVGPFLADASWSQGGVSVCCRRAHLQDLSPEELKPLDVAVGFNSGMIYYEAPELRDNPFASHAPHRVTDDHGTTMFGNLVLFTTRPCSALPWKALLSPAESEPCEEDLRDALRLVQGHLEVLSGRRAQLEMILDEPKVFRDHIERDGFRIPEDISVDMDRAYRGLGY
ncbi:hypothetical protein AK812_SmicGene17182 [Symbiodinium microadriaticum]|uniref:MYND-type domain-containing protein n=1 Tax=Symbiodinium microadriaticum TaxID=2951 RepID=A0A1Q9DYA5_SYMMI|nr:hypothetical protein AK812_SmicGene17182 [Symbiodinium microadriaticum]